VADVGAAALPEPEPVPVPVPAPVLGVPHERSTRTLLDPRKRAIAAGLVVALALVVGIVVLLQPSGGHSDAGSAGATMSHSSAATSPSPTAQQAGAGASASAHASQSQSPSQSPSAVVSSVTSTAASVPASATTSALAQLTQNDGPQLVQFIENYYHLMPGNLDAGWNYMTADYQQNHAGGRSGYDSFWAQFSAVSLSNVTAQAPASVTATITYTYKSGGTTTERTEFGLVVDGGQVKIASSSVV
jgi:hypothetical protein